MCIDANDDTFEERTKSYLRKKLKQVECHVNQTMFANGTLNNYKII